MASRVSKSISLSVGSLSKIERGKNGESRKKYMKKDGMDGVVSADLGEKVQKFKTNGEYSDNNKDEKNKNYNDNDIQNDRKEKRYSDKADNIANSVNNPHDEVTKKECVNSKRDIQMEQSGKEKKDDEQKVSTLGENSSSSKKKKKKRSYSNYTIMSLTSISDRDSGSDETEETRKKSKKKTKTKSSNHKANKNKDDYEEKRKRRHTSRDNSPSSPRRTDDSSLKRKKQKKEKERGRSYSPLSSIQSYDSYEKPRRKDEKKKTQWKEEYKKKVYSKLSSISMSSLYDDDDDEYDRDRDRSRRHSRDRVKCEKNKGNPRKRTSREHYTKRNSNGGGGKYEEGKKHKNKNDKEKNYNRRRDSMDSFAHSISSEESDRKKKKKKKQSRSRSETRKTRGNHDKRTHLRKSEEVDLRKEVKGLGNAKGHYIGRTGKHYAPDGKHDTDEVWHGDRNHGDDYARGVGRKHHGKYSEKKYKHTEKREEGRWRSPYEERERGKDRKIEEKNKKKKGKKYNETDEQKSTADSSFTNSIKDSSYSEMYEYKRRSFGKEGYRRSRSIHESSTYSYTRGRRYDNNVMMRRNKQGERKAEDFSPTRNRKNDGMLKYRLRKDLSKELRKKDEEWIVRRESDMLGKHSSRRYSSQNEDSYRAYKYRHQERGSYAALFGEKKLRHHEGSDGKDRRNGSDGYGESHLNDRMGNWLGERLRDRLGGVERRTGLINREKSCPFLLRLFYKKDMEFSSVDDINISANDLSNNELQIYAWIDITMREIVTLVKDFYEESRNRNAQWIFKAYSKEKNQLTFLSRVHSTRHNHKEDYKTLLSLNYEIGDIILLSILFDGSQHVPSTSAICI
ncbi:histone deacetylase complex subunit SAP18, putative [Plasmodium ovale]|uniref:Histone deacetylase complex subunit SAP18, putative n=2 Tax=Plasmodium ovale TaxID=36330 RepID=A0A1D3KYW3_PLAOA|nr:histone deacetylase complex subunit SAP18, putative (SAP18) [Plasmodium ovale curtisi]SCD22374.1 histone deacetylase complex subunit SAP18, putative [Plasmodium ovale]